VRSEYHRILVSTGSLHGSQQTTILNLMVPLLRLW
jgi:hypothetical protein